MNWKKILQAIKENKRFLISTHVNVDPDAVCSELVVYLFLTSMGKDVRIINQDPLPQRLAIFPGFGAIKPFKKNQSWDYDVAVVVDCGSLDRIGEVAQMLKSDRPVINIDHHITNDYFGDLNLVVPAASSTAEVLYELLDRGKQRMTKEIAVNIYAGILTDTGSFRYENTSPRTHQVAAELLKFDIAPAKLYQKLYDMIPLNDFAAFTRVVSHFRSMCNGKVIYLALTKKILAEFSEAFDLKDGIFKFLRSIKGVEVVVIFTEVERHKTRLNFRSMHRINVARLASHFQGGGHPRASGGMINKDIKSSQKDVLAKLKELL